MVRSETGEEADLKTELSADLFRLTTDVMRANPSAKELDVQLHVLKKIHEAVLNEIKTELDRGFGSRSPLRACAVSLMCTFGVCSGQARS